MKSGERPVVFLATEHGGAESYFTCGRNGRFVLLAKKQITIEEGEGMGNGLCACQNGKDCQCK